MHAPAVVAVPDSGPNTCNVHTGHAGDPDESWTAGGPVDVILDALAEVRDRT